MLWKLALYLAIAWGILCTVLTLTAFTRLGLDALRKRVRGSDRSESEFAVPGQPSGLLTTQPNRHLPG
jgi:hypothetical protein